MNEVPNNIAESVKTIDVSLLLDRLKAWAELAGPLAMVFGFAVALGFICRRYLRFIITVGLVGLLFLKGLEYEGIVRVDWSFLHKIPGIDTSTNLEHLAQQLLDAAKQNVPMSTAAFFGLIIGYKAG